MGTLTSVFGRALRHLPVPRRPERYVSPISADDLTGEYLLIEVPESIPPEAESAVTALLTETHRNGFTAELTDSEGYPSLFPPGASLFGTGDSASRLQDVVSMLERFTHAFRQSETEVVVINAARIEENVRIAEHDLGRSGEIARRNVDTLADCLAALPESCRFVDGDAVPATARDGHLITFQETVLYR